MGITNPTLNTRKLGSIQYQAGGVVSLELDKNGVLLRLLLRLKYTVTAGSSGPATPLFQTLARLIRRVEIMAGGRDVIQAIPGELLALRASYENLSIPSRGMGAAVVTTGTGTATSYDITLPLDFTLPLGQRTDDCAIDTTGLNQLACIVTWGAADASDLFATTNSAAISNVTLDLEGQYVANPFRASNGMAVSSVTGKPYMVRQLDFQLVDVPANNTNFVVTLDSRSGLVLLSTMVVALADNVGSDSVINSVEMDAASFNFMRRDAEEIRASNVKSLHLVNGPAAGVLYLDPRLNGSVNNAIMTGSLDGDLKLTLNVTKQGTACKLLIQREAMRPLITG